MKIYKVTLKPLDWFFFGGESTLDNGVKQSYIAHSEVFPQQTTLLGVLRYQLLKQKGWLWGKEHDEKPSRSDVDSLIGENSFSMEDVNQKFGRIKCLSPVFIEEDKNERVSNPFYPVPLTKDYRLTFDSNVSVYLNGQMKKYLINDNNTFDPKKYSNYIRYQGKDGRELVIDDIFVPRIQIGITKNTDYGQEEDDDKNRFFKREMLKFKTDEFCFAFYVELDEELKNDYVFLGAERSCFKMNVEPQVDATGVCQIYLDNHPSKSERGRIELLSPTYIENLDALNDICDFHWSYQSQFRNLAMVKDGRGKLNSGAISYNRKETSFHFLSAGSVLFFEESERGRVEDLLNDKHLQDIGYNYFNSMNNNIKNDQ